MPQLAPLFCIPHIPSTKIAETNAKVFANCYVGLIIFDPDCGYRECKGKRIHTWKPVTPSMQLAICFTVPALPMRSGAALKKSPPKPDDMVTVIFGDKSADGTQIFPRYKAEVGSMSVHGRCFDNGISGNCGLI